METYILFFLMSYISHSWGNIILIYYFYNKKTIESISFYSQILMIIASILKIIIYLQTELISYSIFLIELIIFIVSLAYLIYILLKTKSNYIFEEKNYFDYRILIILSFLLGIYLCPFKDENNESYLFDYCWTINIFLETFSMLPQVKLMREQRFVRKEVSHYIFAITLSKLFRILFWYYGLKGDYNASGKYFLIFIDFSNILFISDLIYSYFKNRRLNIIPYN